MAANKYYADNYNHSHPYHDDITQHRLDDYPSHTPDTVYEIPPRPYLQQSHSGASGWSSHDQYDDRDSIPLNGRSKQDHRTTVEGRQAVLVDDDPFIRDAKPNRRSGRRDDEDGWFRGKITWVVFVLTTAQIIVFLAEIIKNGILTSSPIEIHPAFNPMIGPSPYVLINMGARYVPCMHNMPNIQNSSTVISWPCPNATDITGPSVSCSLSDLCGNGGVPNPRPGGSITDSPAPNQWWRFIVPIFLHAGIIHIGFNLLLQLTLGREIEKLIGSIRFAIVYFAAGIFGFVLGGNFAASGIASTGCSGSLFGILAITLLDLLYNWGQRRSPVKDLLFIFVDVAIAFVLGLLPGLDNFSHIGGFLMGLVLGVCILRSPIAFSRRTSQMYVTPAATDSRDHGIVSFVRQPVSFFKDRRPIWWAWWFVRAAALFGALIGFILLLENFYVWGTTCGWCKYLSCLPVTVSGTDWCSIGTLQITSNNGTTSKRDILMEQFLRPLGGYIGDTVMKA